MSEPYVPQLIYYPERDEYEFVAEDIPTVERALVPDDSVGLLLRLQEPREAIGFRVAGALVRRVSPLSDGDGWSDDMSVAPRDGSEVMLWYADFCGGGPLTVSGHWHKGENLGLDATWAHSFGFGDADKWRSLPAPPRGEVAHE